MTLQQRLSDDAPDRHSALARISQPEAGCEAYFTVAANSGAAAAERGIFSFGPFKLDPLRRTLVCNDCLVPLTARLFETLLYFVRHPERLVTRDELQNAVWNGRMVEGGNLQKAVSSLRKAMQCGVSGETYIATIAGRGFQFTAPVTFEPSSGSPAGMIAPAIRSPFDGSLWHSRKLQLGIVALLLAASVAAVWRLAPRRTDAPAFAPPAHSVAILPFVNMSGDRSEDYFSDGIADELINTLSRVRGLRVAARTSAFSFKGSDATIGEIGRRLDVSAVLEGAVRREGQRVHIAVQLIDTRTGFQFWSRSYDRDRFLDDMLNVQTDIAETVSASLETKLLHGDAARLTTGGTHNAAAFDAYLRGMKNSEEYGEGNVRRAIADFTAAITLDPAYAQAFAGRAEARLILAVYGYGTDAKSDRDEAALAANDADAAIKLAPTLAEAHRVKSVILLHALAFKGAADELLAAYNLAPDDARVEVTHVSIEARLGHRDAALVAARHAIALDPLNPNAYQRLGQALYWARRFDEALVAYGHANAVETHPSRRNAGWIALALLAKGDPAGAEHICFGGDSWPDVFCLAIAYHALGRPAEAAAKLALLQQMLGNRAAYQYAQIYAQWGQKADAMRWLEIAFTLQDSGLDELKVSPLLDSIRNGTEFGDIERRLNFAD